MLSDHGSRTVQSAFDTSQRFACAIGDLLEGQLLDVSEQDDLAVVVRQGFEGATDVHAQAFIRAVGQLGQHLVIQCIVAQHQMRQAHALALDGGHDPA